MPLDMRRCIQQRKFSSILSDIKPMERSEHGSVII